MKKRKESFVWAAVHFLGTVSMIFKTEKDCVNWCKRNSFNPKSPIYNPIKLYGITTGPCRTCDGSGQCPGCKGNKVTVEPRHLQRIEESKE